MVALVERWARKNGVTFEMVKKCWRESKIGNKLGSAAAVFKKKMRQESNVKDDALEECIKYLLESEGVTIPSLDSQHDDNVTPSQEPVGGHGMEVAPTSSNPVKPEYSQKADFEKALTADGAIPTGTETMDAPYHVSVNKETILNVSLDRKIESLF